MAGLTIRNRRSGLQKAIIEEIRSRHATGTAWINTEGLSTKVAWRYSHLLSKQEYWAFDHGDDGYILSAKFKASYSRSLKSLVEQGIIETQRIGSFKQIRLGFPLWNDQCLRACRENATSHGGYGEKDVAEIRGEIQRRLMLTTTRGNR